MNIELENILLEIEDIIAKIGNYDVRKGRFSEQGKGELIILFKKKIKIAKSINENLKLVC